MAKKTFVQPQEEEIAELRAQLAGQRRELSGTVGDTKSRRGILRLAGAALVGAAGVAALEAVDASATTGGSVILGQSNDANAATQISATASTGPSPILLVNATTGNGTSMDGIDAYGKGGGYGVYSQTDTGIAGQFVSGSGVDIQAGFQGIKGAVGSGRFSQILRSDVAGVAPNWTASSGTGELIRGSDASLWASRSSGTLKASWKRMNSVRFDKADGTGALFPTVRVLDTRVVSGPTGGAPLASGTVYTFPAFTNTHGIPSDAIGITGNFTVVGASGTFPGAGFAAAFPATGVTGSATWPGTSNINYSAGGGAIANSVTIAFGVGGFAGKLSFYTYQSAHVILDVSGYVV